MKSAPHLLPEDRADFERLLDDVLRAARDHPALAGIGRRLTAGQLRALALDASAVISTAAATEYAHFVRAREEHRRRPGVSASAPDPGAPADGVMPGAGLGVVVTVLAPVLAGSAAVVLLLLGYVLKMLDPPPDVAAPLLSAGWFFAAVAVAGLFAAIVGILVTALRNRANEVTAARAAGGGPLDETARAREAWHRALLERGILPFLRDVLAEPPPLPEAARAPVPARRDPAATGPCTPRPAGPEPTGPGPVPD
ncbi:hypothetical protein [Streptomyces sp. CC77]|uniref:hypothetical protein n=1 Tax=Streptomyces sp. CC77 TaxID=1906739 RepID=UPI0008DDF7B0|nr:hypothetical protein [Streptomyces sp. CC77]OII69492.1 hypothetical protein BJP39_03925 [Streptomyces sp. CC77]